MIELVVGVFQFCILLTNNFDNHANFMTVGKKTSFYMESVKGVKIHKLGKIKIYPD